MEDESYTQPALREATGRITVKAHDTDVTEGEFRRALVNFDDWVNSFVAGEAYKRFGLGVRIHITYPKVTDIV
jgi:hypothetical protein